MVNYKNRQKILTILRRRMHGLDALLKPLYHKLYMAFNYAEREQMLKLGKIKTKNIFYIIRINNMSGGLFSLFNSVMSHINYCDKHGWVPVVDLKNYPNNYLKEEEIGKINIWDVFFNQPPSVLNLDITLESAYHCEGAILSCSRSTIDGSNLNANTIDDKNAFERYKFIFEKYIQLQQKIVINLQNYVELYLANNRVIGVSLRGTDYISSRPFAHPIQPTIEEAICLTREKLNEWNCDKVYLATEDASYVDRFKEEFSDKLVTFNRRYIKTDSNNQYETVFKQLKASVLSEDYNERDVGFDYIYSTLLVSKCTSAILSRTSVTPFILFNGSYENLFIWDKGLYGIDD